MPPQDPFSGPGIWPLRPPQFRMPRIVPPNAPPENWQDLIPMPESIVDLPSGIDPGKTVRGMASYQGPRLNTEQAMTGLRESQFQPKPQIPTEELYRKAFMQPSQPAQLPASHPAMNVPRRAPQPSVGLAPGAQESARRQLGVREGVEDFSRLLGQQRQETIAGAETAQVPAVRQFLEEEAQRGAYPAQAAAGAQALAAHLGLQGRLAGAEATVEGQRAARDRAILGELIQHRAQLSEPLLGETDQETKDRIQQLQAIDELIDMARSGVFMLSDFADEDLIDAGLLAPGAGF